VAVGTPHRVGEAHDKNFGLRSQGTSGLADETLEINLGENNDIIGIRRICLCRDNTVNFSCCSDVAKIATRSDLDYNGR
jgi:hypothetical protein